ncbi:MAG TPA: hypothetical protein VES19_13745, partial [Candidatus Limnocylindrales bacterium]|nr:hypothetical protein [Candidatus Limnocylindrales bacterium]
MNQGERAARERVEAVYLAVDRLTPDDLRLTPMQTRDAETRALLVARVESVAADAGRGILLGEARSWLREAIGARTLARYQPEAGVWGVPSGGVVQDRVEVLLALEDAVSVAVTQDLLDPDEAALLADPGRRLLGLEPLPVPGVAAEPPPNAWEPSATDWAAAAGEGPAAVDPDEPMAGSRTVQRAVFGTLGAFAVAFALLYGITTDQLVLGI